MLAQKKVQGEAGYDRLAYFDWSAAPGSSLTDRDAWAQANPGLGIRISEDFIADELPDLGRPGSAVSGWGCGMSTRLRRSRSRLRRGS